MSSLDTGHLLYLVLLGSLVAIGVLAANRRNLGRTLQQSVIWGLLFLAVIAGYGMWEDVRRTVLPNQAVITAENRIEVPRHVDGHYYLTLEVNGTPVQFMVDTGASMVVLSREDAAHVGIDTDDLQFYGSAMTANGEVRTAPVLLDSIGPFDDAGFRAWVNAGAMDRSLLGMSYLQRYSTIQISDGRLILIR